MEFLVTVLLCFVAMIIVIAAMSVGVMAGRSPIRGSCGGVGGGGCELCSGRCSRRRG